MAERDPNRWDRDVEDAPFLDPGELLAIRAELAAEESQRQEALQTAIQDILESDGPMLGTLLYMELKKRFPSITISEYRNARLALGYPLDPNVLFTLKRD